MQARRSSNPLLWAPIVNLVLGAWLFVSAFVWPHAGHARANTWILGLLIAVFALYAIAQPTARWLNTLAAIWLFFSSLAIGHMEAATVWNNVIVAVIVFALSFVGRYGDRRVTPAGTRTAMHA
jgi:hypothetical protein